MINTKTKHYAKVLVEMVVETKWQTVMNNFIKISALIDAEKAFYNFITLDDIELNEKKTFLKKNFKLSELEINFILLLVRDKKIKKLKNIIIQAEELYYEKKNVAKVEVQSVIELTKDQIKKIEKIITDKTDTKIEIVNKLMPAIKGGLLISIGDKQIDLSIRGKIDQLKKII